MIFKLPCKKEKLKEWKKEREEKKGTKERRKKKKFWGSKRKTYNRKIKYKIGNEVYLRGKQSWSIRG